MGQNLVIVESPAKAKTIQKYLGDDFLVKSCFGHIRDLPKKNDAIDVNNDFAQKYIVPEEKKQVVKELKKLSDKANYIYLASDEDREGEAISWHLFEALELEQDKTKRIVFHEITEKALQHAIKNPREIDTDLVRAQQARRVLDRLVGFELSPILWKKIQPKLSAGRVQSVAVRLIVEREREIEAFKTTFNYKVQGLFVNDKHSKTPIRANLDNDFNTLEEVVSFLKKSTNQEYRIEKVDIKKGKRRSSAPYITSTLQQEASRKLGFKVATTMSIAQKLYEAGYITYMRTDSLNLSEDAIQGMKGVITKEYGEEYSQSRRFKSKNPNAQEAHEAIRPTKFDVQKIPLDAICNKLYYLIWQKTIASQMADAQIETTTFKIGTPKLEEKFVAKGEVIIFDGFLKIYERKNLEKEDTVVLPKLNVDDTLTYEEISSRQKFSNHPPRYTEGSLVDKLEQIGVGRPSTYAPTIATIQNRGYVEIEQREGEEREYDYISLKEDNIKIEKKKEVTGAEKNKFFPTDTAKLVNTFLMDNFGKVVDYNFTANLEKEFDSIATGDKVWTNTIKNFYTPFHEDIKKATSLERVSGERLLGIDKKTNKNVYTRITKFGSCVQLGEISDEEKPRYSSLTKEQSIETITLKEALKLFELPREVGEYNGETIIANKGRFGPYIKVEKLFVSIPKDISVYEIDLETAVELYKEKVEAEAKKHIKEFEKENIKVLNGRFGPYISYEKKNYKIPKDLIPEDLNLEGCQKIIKEGKKKPKFRRGKKK